jgi:type IV pilus assembly protein PilM
VTKALVTGLGMDQAQAERLKATHGVVRESYNADSAAALETVVKITEDLLTSIRNTLTFYSESRPQAPIKSVVLSGGGSRLRGFSAALEELTRLKVEIGDPTHRFTLSRRVNPSKLPSVLPAMAVALGLTLRSAS